jgi:Fe-S oxidoreductase
MAGAFGYEAEHYPVSKQVGELALLPTVRAASPDVVIAASGVSCQAQIKDGTERVAVHPIELLSLGCMLTLPATASPDPQLIP